MTSGSVHGFHPASGGKSRGRAPRLQSTSMAGGPAPRRAIPSRRGSLEAPPRDARPPSPPARPRRGRPLTSVAQLIAGKRIVVCAGSGGVGKTTTAAALGMGAAALGAKVAVVTIDPARRLANSLGLPEL